MNDIGKILKNLRRQKNFTQTYVGEKVGATQPTIWRWETFPESAEQIPIGILEKYAKLFDMPTIELLKMVTFEINKETTDVASKI